MRPMPFMRRTDRILTGAAALIVLLAAAPAPAADLAAGEIAAVERCAACHGKDGNTPIDPSYPRLSGQHADYTAAQLTSFRDGGRTNSVVMTQVASKLNDREIRAVSDYIAGLR